MSDFGFAWFEYQGWELMVMVKPHPGCLGQIGEWFVMGASNLRYRGEWACLYIGDDQVDSLEAGDEGILTVEVEDFSFEVVISDDRQTVALFVDDEYVETQPVDYTPLPSGPTNRERKLAEAARIEEERRRRGSNES